MNNLIIALPLTIISAFLNALGFFYFKKASSEFSLNVKRIINNKNLIFGVVSFVTGALMYIVALRFGNLSLLYPISATQYIWIVVLGYGLLNEKISTSKLSGIALIILGIIFIGFG